MHGNIAMAKHKAPVRLRVLSNPVSQTVHDRKATDGLRNAIVGTVVVDDPWAAIAGERIVVVRSLRDDPLAGLHDRRQIDEAQFLAGRHWQRVYELCEVGGARAIDPTKEAVDGGRFPEPLSDKAAKALLELRTAARALGQEGEAIVRDVLGAGLSLVQCAHKRDAISTRDMLYIGRRLRECLETLAVTFGYAQKARY